MNDLVKKAWIEIQIYELCLLFEYRMFLILSGKKNINE
jgi:hypothetical protein